MDINNIIASIVFVLSLCILCGVYAVARIKDELFELRRKIDRVNDENKIQDKYIHKIEQEFIDVVVRQTTRSKKIAREVVAMELLNWCFTLVEKLDMWHKLTDKSISFPSASSKVLVTNENIDWYDPSKYSLIEVEKLLEICDKPYCQWTHWMKIPSTKVIDEDELNELAHKHCMDNGYSNLDEKEYIPMGNTQWGDVMFDIEEAYKAGYRKAWRNKK